MLNTDKINGYHENGMDGTYGSLAEMRKLAANAHKELINNALMEHYNETD